MRILGVISECNHVNDKDCRYLSVIDYRPINHYEYPSGNDPKSRSAVKRAYNPPVIPAVGSLIGPDNYPNQVSYRGIEDTNTVHDPKDYSIIHSVEIRDFSVYLNNTLIASAPAGWKNKTRKTKFCKSVVWALLNDDTTLTDKLTEISAEKPITGVVQYHHPLLPYGYLPHLKVSIVEVTV